MTNLTTKIKATIGPAKSGGGRGMRWYWCIDQNGEYRRGQQENNFTRAKLSKAFEGWLLKRSVTYTNTKTNTSTTRDVIDYIYIVKNKKGDFVGTCQMPASIYEDAIVIVNYSNDFVSEETVHEYNKAMEDMVSYERI